MNASVASFSPRHHHRKFRNPITSYHRRRYKTPGTPQLSWKFNERQRAYGGVEVSARKLAAGLWQLHLLAGPSDSGVKCGSYDHFKFQHESFVAHPNSLMEGVTKWGPSRSRTSTKAYWLYNHGKLLEDQVTNLSVVSPLQAELVQARLRINELEDEQRSFKMKFENLMRKLGEERYSWYIRKHHKMQAIIDDLKDELSKETKSRNHIDFLISKFANDLAKAESPAKQLMQDYEEEKRARKLLEEVCKKLAKKIGEHKVELEMLKGETTRIRREVEEERNMLQLAEIWREERVQMKLVDAKLALERKYYQMNKLVEELESFLMSSEATLDVTALRKADFIRRAIESVNIQECEEFEYVPPESDSISSIFEELRTAINEREMEVELLTNYNLLCDHIASGQVKDFECDHNGFEEDFGASESARHADDHGSRCSIERSNHSLNSVSQGKVTSKSIVIYNGNAGQHSTNTVINGVHSITGDQLRLKACSVSQRRSDEGGDESVQNRTISSVRRMRKSVNGGCGQRDSTGQQFISPDLGNPHITQGMKVSIEWPRVTRKSNLKGKLLKAMMENQKTHLRKVLK